MMTTINKKNIEAFLASSDNRSIPIFPVKKQMRRKVFKSIQVLVSVRFIFYLEINVEVYDNQKYCGFGIFWKKLRENSDKY